MESSDASWKKDVDIARAVENTVVGAILFVGRYFATFAVFMGRPDPLAEPLLFNETYKNTEQVDYVRPLSFLIVSGFIYLAFTMPTAGQLIPLEHLLDAFKVLIDRIPRKLEDLTLAKIAAFMLPFVLFVAAYALLSSRIFRVLGLQSHFKVHLNITSYSCGSFAVFTSSWAMLESPAWDMALHRDAGLLQLAPLILISFLFLAGMAWTLFRYVALLRMSARGDWGRTLLGLAFSFAIFWTGLGLALSLLHPFIQRIQ